jgi:hypothetical protein
MMCEADMFGSTPESNTRMGACVVCMYVCIAGLSSCKKQVPLTLAFDAALSKDSLNKPARDVKTRDEE